MVKRICVDTAAYLFLPAFAAPEPADVFVLDGTPLSGSFPCCILDPESGRQYPSLEHFLQCRKIAFHVAFLQSQASYAENWEQLAESLLAGTVSLEAVKKQTRKSRMMQDEQELEGWAYQSHMTLIKGWTLKFSQNPECIACLAATGTARLFYRASRRGGVERWTGLERIRGELQ